MAFRAGDRIYEDDEVAGLFDRHLIFFGLLAAAVVLAVRQRVLAEIMWSEGEVPGWAWPRIRVREVPGLRGVAD